MHYIACERRQIVSLRDTSYEEFTYNNQSTASITATSSVGNPTADNTITMVTKPAWGTPAAPIAAAVAVMLDKDKDLNEVCWLGYMRTMSNWLLRRAYLNHAHKDSGYFFFFDIHEKFTFKISR